jgi:hypothetical protein
VWHGGVHVDRSTVVGSTIKGDVVTPPPPPGEPPLVVTDALRAEVFGLLALLAREGLAGEPDVAEAADGLRHEMAQTTTRGSRIASLLAPIERHGAKIALVQTALTAIATALAT